MKNEATARTTGMTPTFAMIGRTLVAIRDGAVVPQAVMLAGEPCPFCRRLAAHAPTCPVVR